MYSRCENAKTSGLVIKKDSSLKNISLPKIKLSNTFSDDWLSYELLGRLDAFKPTH
jgi:hypothetical protein